MPQAELTEPVSNETYMPKFFAFDGRIGRLRYWAYAMGWGMLAMPVFFLFAIMGATTGSLGTSLAGSIIGMVIGAVAYLVIAIMLARRRLADLGQTGWLAVLVVIPYVCILFSLYLLFAPGNTDANEYGPAPAPNTTGVKLLAWIPALIFIIGIVAAIAIPAYSGYTAKARAAQMGQ